MAASSKQYNTTAHTRLKAEAFCTELLSVGMSFDDLVIRLVGSFRKSYRSEVEKVDLITQSNNGALEMEIVLNRDGLYDRIPEGVFHQSMGNKRTEKVSDMLEEHKRYQEEEKWVRKFFQPFEQEFFRYSTMVEMEEQQVALAMLSGTLNNELLNFWNIDKDLPADAVKVLSRIMPWARYIKGDVNLTSKALELILAKPVSAVAFTKTLHQTDEPLGDVNTEMELGINTVMGNTFEEPCPCWKFTIGELTKNEIWLFSGNNKYSRLLNHFTEIFIPLTIDIIFDFGLMESTIADGEDVLGYSMVL